MEALSTTLLDTSLLEDKDTSGLGSALGRLAQEGFISWKEDGDYELLPEGKWARQEPVRLPLPAITVQNRPRRRPKPAQQVRYLPLPGTDEGRRRRGSPGHRNA